MKSGVKVCMKLNNAFENDARVEKEASSLAQAGYELTIIAKYKSGLAEEEKLNGFTVKRVKKANPIPLYSVIKALWLQKADIYHAHDLDSLPPAFLVAKIRGAKLVYDSHEYWRGFDEKKINWKRKVFLYLEGVMTRRADLLISVNPSIVNKIAGNYGYKGEKIVLYNAPLKKNNTGKSPVKPKTKYSVIHVGAIQNGRGLDIMLKSLEYLPKDYTLYLLGPDNYAGGFENLVKKMKLESRVVMLGIVPSKEVTTYASFADVALVLTQNLSENYYLSLPNKLFESISAGLPVVASNMLEIARLVEAEGIGEVCDIENPKDIAEKIVKVCENGSVYKKETEEASKKYCWEIEGRKLVDAYKKIKAV